MKTIISWSILGMSSYLHTVLRIIGDICFPPTETALCVRTLTTSRVHALYNPVMNNSIHVLSSFGQPEIRALVHETKFHANARATLLLATLVETYLKNNPNLRDAIWVPIPLSAARLRMRGYNQTAQVLKHLPTLIQHERVLVRTRDTLPQTELDRTERLTNMHDAFTVRENTKLRGKDIVLFDDVTTTSATLKAAKAAFKNHHHRSITLLALAH